MLRRLGQRFGGWVRRKECGGHARGRDWAYDDRRLRALSTRKLDALMIRLLTEIERESNKIFGGTGENG